MQQRSKQQGGVIAYVIVGVVLLGLLAGGVYLAKHQARVARNDSDVQPQPIGQQDEQQSEESGQQQSTDSDDQSQPAGDEQRPSAGEADRPQSDSSTSQDQDIARTGPSEIAATGPLETGAALIASGALTGATVTYVRSKRHLRRLP